MALQAHKRLLGSRPICQAHGEGFLHEGETIGTQTWVTFLLDLLLTASTFLEQWPGWDRLQHPELAARFWPQDKLISRTPCLIRFWTCRRVSINYLGISWSQVLPHGIFLVQLSTLSCPPASSHPNDSISRLRTQMRDRIPYHPPASETCSGVSTLLVRRTPHAQLPYDGHGVQSLVFQRFFTAFFSCQIFHCPPHGVGPIGCPMYDTRTNDSCLGTDPTPGVHLFILSRNVIATSSERSLMWLRELTYYYFFPALFSAFALYLLF